MNYLNILKIKMYKKGMIFSETQFYVVESVQNNGDVNVVDELGNNVILSKEYVDKILNSADNFTTEKKVTATELAHVFVSNSHVAMTVCFRKKDTPKSAKAIKQEKEDLKNKMKSANLVELSNLIDSFIDNPINTVIPGELRVMKGRHNATQDDLGRYSFIDMEQSKTSAPIDSRLRQVDTRTLVYVIVGNVKYSLK